MTAKFTEATLAEALGIPFLPQAPEGVLERAVSRYENGKAESMFDPAYYRDLHEKYGCLPRSLDSLCAAAEKIRKIPALAVYAIYLEEATTDRRFLRNNPGPISYPVAPNGKANIAYDLVAALPVASMIPASAERMRARSTPEDVLLRSLLYLDTSIHEYETRNGHPGFRLFEWCQRSIDALLYRPGRLEVEIGRPYKISATVFRGQDGSLAVLSNGSTVHKSGLRLGSAGCTDTEGCFETALLETADVYRGNPVNADGLIERKPISLRKSEWTPILRPGDTVLGLHIPSEGPFTPEDVDEALADIKRFLGKFAGRETPKAYYCESWLLDPTLKKCLPEQSNIVSFQNRFRKLPGFSAGNEVYYFLFGYNRGVTPTPDELPADTSLRRAVKDLYRQGEFIRSTPGLIFLDD